MGAPRARRNSTICAALVRAAHASGVDWYSSSRAEILAPASSRTVACSRAAPVVSGPTTDEVKQRLMLPVHEVRAHTMRQQRTKHVRVFQEIALAAGEDWWHTDARFEQPPQQVPFSLRHDSGEHRRRRLKPDLPLRGERLRRRLNQMESSGSSLPPCAMSSGRSAGDAASVALPPESDTAVGIRAMSEQ